MYIPRIYIYVYAEAYTYYLQFLYIDTNRKLPIFDNVALRIVIAEISGKILQNAFAVSTRS